MDIFPPAHIILMLISGTIVFELSPLHFWVPKIVLDPFLNNIATDILSGLGIIGVSAFAIGIVLILLDSLVFGNKGINVNAKIITQNIMKKLRLRTEKPDSTTSEPEVTIRRIGFYHWMREKGYNGYYDFFVVRDFVIRGFLLGFEISFIANLFFLILLADSCLISVKLFIPLVLFETFLRETIGFCIFSSLFFALFYFYDKKLWRTSYHQAIQPIIDEYNLKKDS